MSRQGQQKPPDNQSCPRKISPPADGPSLCGDGPDFCSTTLTSVEPSPSAGNRRAVLAVCAFLLLAVGLVFGQAIQYGFTNYDDDVYVYDNPQIQHGLTIEGIGWALTTGYGSNWHPLTWLSLMLDDQLYGLRPWGYHLTNVLLHAATTILLFLVLWRMTGDLWPAALATAIFAIHPLRAESVAWVTERKDVLSGLFFMLTLAAYLGYVRRPFSPARYLLVLATFTLALMAKLSVVTLPFVLLLLDYWPLGRWEQLSKTKRSLVPTLCVGTQFLDAPASHEILNQGSALDNGTPKHPGRAFPRGAWERGQYKRLVLEKIPLFLLALAACAATLMARGRSTAALKVISFPSRISNALVSYMSYLDQFFHPVNLAAFYPHPGTSLAWWKTAAALLILIGVSAVAIVLWRRWPCLLVGWFWYLVMLVPMIGLVQVAMPIAQADRYTYLSQIGLCIAIAWGAERISRHWPYRRWVVGVTSALAVMSLAWCAGRQVSYWKDSETLWRHILACTSKNWLAHNNFGNDLADRGQVDAAIAQYKTALKIKPDYTTAHYNLGLAYAGRGQSDEAIAHYQEGPGNQSRLR